MVNARVFASWARGNGELGVGLTGVAIFLTDRVNINQGANIAAGGRA